MRVIMEGFDDPGVFFSDNFSVDDNQSDLQVNLQAVKKKFKEFIRQYHTDNFNYKYRCDSQKLTFEFL